MPLDSKGEATLRIFQAFDHPIRGHGIDHKTMAKGLYCLVM